jgi:hypothetical protein
MTKHQLFSALATAGTAWITLPDGTKGILQGIRRESGCGRSFLVNLLVGKLGVTKCVRTID